MYQENVIWVSQLNLYHAVLAAATQKKKYRAKTAICTDLKLDIDVICESWWVFFFQRYYEPSRCICFSGCIRIIFTFPLTLTGHMTLLPRIFTRGLNMASPGSQLALKNSPGKQTQARQKTFLHEVMCIVHSFKSRICSCLEKRQLREINELGIPN